MKLIELSKQRLQGMREDGWNSLFKEVYVFVQKTILLFPSISTAVTTKSSKHEKFTSLPRGVALLYCYGHATLET